MFVVDSESIDAAFLIVCETCPKYEHRTVTCCPPALCRCPICGSLVSELVICQILLPAKSVLSKTPKGKEVLSKEG